MLHSNAPRQTNAPAQAASVPAGGVQMKSLGGVGFDAQSAALTPVQRSASPVGGREQRAPVAQGPVQRRAVQRVSLSGQGNVGATETETVRDRASDRGNTMGSGEMMVRGASQGVANVSMGDQSMAENPDFERDAAAFETQLGVSAYALGNGPAGEMAKKGKDYLMAKAGVTEWKATETRLAEMVVKLGSDNPAWSGTVGKAVEDLLAVFDRGNVATRMCHLENLWGMINQDIKLNVESVDDMLQKAGILEADIARHRDTKGSNPFHIPANSEVEGQGQTRFEDPNKGAHRTTMTVGSVGVPLDGAEAEVQIPGYDRNSGPPPEQARLQWEEGARIWLMNETNTWVHLMRQLSMPLGAGPSGTTNKIMNLGAVLGMDPFKTRLACIGYLLPSHHHTLCEIMEGAAPHGANDFIRGRMMYTSISPWTPTQLKGFGGGKFPHEGQRAAPVVAPQPV